VQIFLHPRCIVQSQCGQELFAINKLQQDVFASGPGHAAAEAARDLGKVIDTERVKVSAGP
jgi:hypothetical protein